MFTPQGIFPVLPAHDLERAKSFYRDKLGMHPEEANDAQARYRAGNVDFFLFRSTGKASGDHSQAAFAVDDLASTVSYLCGQGVAFETYDLPGLKTVDGIAEFPDTRRAWFKDSEGNLITIAESRSGHPG